MYLFIIITLQTCCKLMCFPYPNNEQISMKYKKKKELTVKYFSGLIIHFDLHSEMIILPLKEKLN